MNILEAFQHHVKEIVDDIYDELFYTNPIPLATCRTRITGKNGEPSCLSIKIHHPILLNHHWAFIQGKNTEHSISITLDGIKLTMDVEQMKERGCPAITHRDYDLQDPNNTSTTDISHYVRELMLTRP